MFFYYTTKYESIAKKNKDKGLSYFAGEAESWRMKKMINLEMAHVLLLILKLCLCSALFTYIVMKW